MQCAYGCNKVGVNASNIVSPPYELSSKLKKHIEVFQPRHESQQISIYGGGMLSPRRTRNKSYQQALHPLEEEELSDTEIAEMAKTGRLYKS